MSEVGHMPEFGIRSALFPGQTGGFPAVAAAPVAVGIQLALEAIGDVVGGEASPGQKFGRRPRAKAAAAYKIEWLIGCYPAVPDLLKETRVDFHGRKPLPFYQEYLVYLVTQG